MKANIQRKLNEQKITDPYLLEILDEYTKQIKKVQTVSILAGGNAACTEILKRINEAKTDAEAIESVKKFCNASINLHKTQELLYKNKESDNV